MTGASKHISTRMGGSGRTRGLGLFVKMASKKGDQSSCVAKK